MAKQNSINLPITDNADGFDATGGTTPRKLTITGADVIITGVNSHVYTFPGISSTLASSSSGNVFTGASTTTSWTLTTPVIAGGLIAVGSGLNDFSGSTGGFKTSTGANQLSGATTVTDTGTPSLTVVGGGSGTGFLQVNGKTNGALKITTADSTSKIVTMSLAAQTVGNATLTILDMAGVNKTLAWLESPSFTGVGTTDLFATNNHAVIVTANAGTCSQSFELNTFTNSSAATMAITLGVVTPTPKDGQLMTVRVYDFSAVAQTIGWTNTENSTVSVPTTSNGSTTLPLTVVFMYNAQTSKWRCILSV